MRACLYYRKLCIKSSRRLMKMQVHTFPKEIEFRKLSDDIDPNLLKGLTSADDENYPVNIIQDKQSAQRILDKIKELGPSHIHACDTEVGQIDIKAVGPVGNGIVTCLSIYSGPDVDYGNGPYVWIDNLDAAYGTLDYFREFLEAKTPQKVWHNYSFDRHVIFNHNKINVAGLAGDTMHMARLWNTARFQRGGYTLEALSTDILQSRKRPMKELFGIPKLKKDGSEGKGKIMPSIENLQRSPTSRNRWIRYSAYDAESTWFLHRVLRHKLQEIQWGDDGTNMYDFYRQYFVPFGECLTDIERKGMHVDLDYLSQVEAKAIEDRERLETLVKQWATRYCGEEAQRFNVSSAAQKQQLLFAPYNHPKTGVTLLEKDREFDIENIEGYIEDGKTKAKKTRKMKITGLGIKPIQLTASGLPAATADVLKELAGNPHASPPKFGRAYKHFKDKNEGAEACIALRALYDINSINTMLNNFILPLQDLADSNSRVHCSLNLNTDTGRLSARKPNLQNQPALEKDRYKIRDAFTAPKGKKLIVADYSQLELRLLAHMASCKAMISAFAIGGDFHSRTAMSMYRYVAKAIEKGEAVLEEGTSGQQGIPLLKDKFPNERRNAKILNFSIAYGKTPFGLAKDFGVSRKEAAEILDMWYADRQEVREWQNYAIQTARQVGYTRSLMGRYRRLPDAMLSGKENFSAGKSKAHAERAAINTPIQGAAADVVMQAMLKIHENERLRELGWEMVCQIHDEIIVEGPEESEEEALTLVKQLMENPFGDKPISVGLQVDAKANTSWYKAK